MYDAPVCIKQLKEAHISPTGGAVDRLQYVVVHDVDAPVETAIFMYDAPVRIKQLKEAHMSPAGGGVDRLPHVVVYDVGRSAVLQ